MKKNVVLLAGIGLLSNIIVRAGGNSALTEPVKSVYSHYLKIQAALVQDSMKGASENANAMSKAIRDDDKKTIPSEAAKEAEALAKATDVSSAREDFKPLSELLIKNLADNKVKSGSYVEVYCPMANASWLQEGKEVSNPYLGKSMSGCGEIKHTYSLRKFRQ
jgi:hypothetical protein